MANEDAQRLARIINDTLNLAKLESGKAPLVRKETDIMGLVRNSVKDIELEAAKKKISISLELLQEPPRLFIDGDKISEVIVNLLGNAVKFTPEGGKIAILIKGTKDQAEISVKDTGIGVAKEDIPNLFSRFFQAGRLPGPGPKGTGLGLAICREIIQLHGGRIWAQGEPGKGSTFTFTLPVASNGNKGQVA
jgi:signal transduction histidine kinase